MSERGTIEDAIVTRLAPLRSEFDVVISPPAQRTSEVAQRDGRDRLTIKLTSSTSESGPQTTKAFFREFELEVRIEMALYDSLNELIDRLEQLLIGYSLYPGRDIYSVSDAFQGDDLDGKWVQTCNFIVPYGYVEVR